MDNPKRVLVKIGGSLLFEEDGIKTDRMDKFLAFLAGHPQVQIVVTGGGLFARYFIRASRILGATESEGDLLGIYQSRLNARLLIAAARARGIDVYPEPPVGIEELACALVGGHLVILGGFQPGQSTTSVALEVAEYARVDEVWVLTDVDGIYDADPRTTPSAKKLDEITLPELEALIQQGSAAAGEYRIFDGVSLQVLRRSHLHVRVLPGDDFQRLDRLFHDAESRVGTRIVVP